MRHSSILFVASIAALIFSGLARLDAVIIFSDGSATGQSDAANKVAPTGALADSGWQWQGQFSAYTATAIAPNWILTAEHLSLGVGTPFVFNGRSYTTTEAATIPGTDLRLFKVNGTFDSYAPLYNRASETGKQAVIMGRGTQRGSAVTVNSTLKGWKAGPGDGTQRWGTNTIAGTSLSLGPTLYTIFDNTSGPNEAQLGSGDSGGGMFINDNGVWKLAGVNFSVTGPYSTSADGSNPFLGAIYDITGIYEGGTTFVPAYKKTRSYFSRVSSSYGQISAITKVGSWYSDASGAWSQATNWGLAGLYIPNGVDATAEFMNNVIASTTVTVDSQLTLGTLVFNSPNAGYTIQNSAGSTLTFDVSAINPRATVRSVQGTHALAVPVVMNKDLAFDIQTGRLNVTGSLSNSSGNTITKTGAGELVIGGTQLHSAGSRFIASAGSTTFDSDPGMNLAVTVGNRAALTLGSGANHHIGSLTIQSGGNFAGPEGLGRVTELGALMIESGGKLNLKEGGLVVRNGSIAAIRTQLRLGKAPNATSGITSDLSDFGITTAIGFANGKDPRLSPFLGGSLYGQSYDANSLILKYTLLGDADLDGDTDLNDLGLWATAYTGDLGNPLNPVTTWTSGDFDYDGDTDLNDLGSWASKFTGDLGGPGSSLVYAPYASTEAINLLNGMGLTVIPEPSTYLYYVMLVVSAYALHRRQRKAKLRPIQVREDKRGAK